MLDFQDYPRYDRETMTRKVTAVIGPERAAAFDNLDDDEWSRVFELCAMEYTMRRILLVSARTMNQLEDRCYQVAGRDSLNRRLIYMQELAKHG
jgi:hypothetical protein